MRRRDRRAQGMVEYALIVSMMALIIIGAAVAIGAAVRSNLQTTANRM